MTISASQGRTGDVWRLSAPDQQVTVTLRNPLKIVFKRNNDSDGRKFGYSKRDWEYALERFREPLDTLNPGDTAHVYVPETDVYIVEVAASESDPSEVGWVTCNTGRAADPEHENTLFFDPSGEWNLTGEIIYRPFQQLEEGDRFADNEGKQWTYKAPFTFLDAEGNAGHPMWPLTIPGDPERSAELNRTSEADQKEQWSQHAGVSHEVLDSA